MAERPFETANVATVFDAYPDALRVKLLALRTLIFETALAEDVGRIEETLKWGQPSYLTPETKSGTTIRIDRDETFGGDYALYVSCQSRLVEEWRAHYPDMSFGGNRSLHFRAAEALPEGKLRHCIAMALTYHRRRKRRKANMLTKNQAEFKELEQDAFNLSRYPAFIFCFAPDIRPARLPTWPWAPGCHAGRRYCGASVSDYSPDALN